MAQGKAIAGRAVGTGAPAVTGEEIVARLERLPVSRWHVQARVVIGVATFFDGFDVLAMTFVLPVLAVEWKLAPEQIGLILSAAFAGQLLGTVTAGWLAERYGRLRVANYTILIFAASSLLCAMAWNAPMLMAMRFLQGVGLGGEVPVAATYISEIARARGRGRFFLLYELLFPIGLYCAAVLGFWLVPRWGWQSMFYIGAAPAILVFFLRRVLPESPRWLASQGRLAEADAVVRRIEQSIADSGQALPPPATRPAPALQGPTRWQELFSGIYRRRTLVVWVMCYSCYTITYGLTTWLPTLYRTLFHLPLSQALGYGLVTQTVGLVGSTACALLIDRIGRRIWFAVAFVGGGLALCLVWIMGVSALSVLVCASLSFFFIASISLALNLYTSELYPTRMRALGSSLASAWVRIAAAVGPTLIGLMLAAHEMVAVFVLFGGIAVAGGVVTALGAVETRGRMLEEVSP